MCHNAEPGARPALGAEPSGFRAEAPGPDPETPLAAGLGKSGGLSKLS